MIVILLINIIHTSSKKIHYPLFQKIVFVIVVKSVKRKADVIKIADKLSREICNPLVFNDDELCYSPSIGAVLFPEHYGDAEFLIQCADKAMYKAKYEGGNRLVFYNEGIKLSGTKNIK